MLKCGKIAWVCVSEEQSHKMIVTVMKLISNSFRIHLRPKPVICPIPKLTKLHLQAPVRVHFPLWYCYIHIMLKMVVGRWYPTGRANIIITPRTFLAFISLCFALHVFRYKVCCSFDRLDFLFMMVLVSSKNTFVWLFHTIHRLPQRSWTLI